MSAPDFRDIFDASPNPYMVLDRERRYVAANRAYLKVTASTLESLLGRRVFDLFPNDPSNPNDASQRKLRESIDRVFETGKPDVLPLLPYRVPMTAPDGKVVVMERFWSATHTPVFGAGGEVAFLLQHTSEVSQLAEAGGVTEVSNTALAQSVLSRAAAAQQDRAMFDEERRRLLGMFQQAPGFLTFLRGPKLVFELANPAYFQLVGHRDILNRPLREALPEMAGQGFFELIEQVFGTGETYVGRGVRVLVQRVPGAPLTEAFVDFVYQPIFGLEGEVAGILAQGHDVTEAKREETRRQAVEEALRTSEERYRSLFQSIDDGYCLLQLIFDGEGKAVDYRLLEVNAAFEGQTGLKNALGKTARELLPTLDESWVRLYAKVATTGESARFENHAPAMGRWFDVYASRVGKPEAHQVALVFKDITQRRSVDEERKTLLRLEQEARANAENANRMKDDFLATVSHELRTPLTSVLGWSQLLRSGGLPADKQQKAIETIERNARAQAELIEDLLDVSRILSGKLKLEMTQVSVTEIADQAIESVRPAADAKSIKLSAALDVNEQIVGDPQRLQQVLWNLLTNAVKFTPRGGRVSVEVDRHDASVVIAVTDTGEGIAPSFLPHVFERFRQADAGTTRKQGGLGLGLSIVKHVVEAHGGTITAQSEGAGKGAVFTVTLPVSAAGPRIVHEPPPASSFRGIVRCPPELPGKTVLVLDDEADTRELLKALLERCSVKVITAASSKEALPHVTAARPDLILSDIGMPEEDGLSFIEKVRGLDDEKLARTPAVALTAFARSEDRTRALIAGFNNHVPKPLDPLELLAVMASLLRANRR